MGKEKLRNIRNWLFRNGRYLDVVRWNFHFEDGSIKEVLKALSVYRNSDGGFGKELVVGFSEESTLLDTVKALRILYSCGLPEEANEMIKKSLSYLVKDGILEIGEEYHLCGEDYSDIYALIISFSLDEISKERATKRLRTLYSSIKEGYQLNSITLSSLNRAIDILKRSNLSEEILGNEESINKTLKIGYSNLLGEPSINLVESSHSIFIELLGEDGKKLAKETEETAEDEGYWEIDDEDMENGEMENLHLKSDLTINNMLFLQYMKPKDLIIIDRVDEEN